MLIVCLSIGFFKMVNKSKSLNIFRTTVFLDVRDWEQAQKIAKKYNLNGSDMVRKWMREGIEREKKRG